MQTAYQIHNIHAIPIQFTSLEKQSQLCDLYDVIIAFLAFQINLKLYLRIFCLYRTIECCHYFKNV